MRKAFVRALATTLWFFTACAFVYFGLNGVLDWLGLRKVPFASVFWGCVAVRGLGSIWFGFAASDESR